jgi:hypothetical protein
MPVLLWIEEEGAAYIHISKKGQTFLSTKSIGLVIAKKAED